MEPGEDRTMHLRNGSKLIVAYDDEDMRKMLCEKTGLKVENILEASSQEEVAEFLQIHGEDNIAGMVINAHLQGISTASIIKRIRERSIEFPIIVLSGSASPEHDEAGATNFLIGPDCWKLSNALKDMGILVD